jgi:predicted metal-dependent hydrolase
MFRERRIPTMPMWASCIRSKGKIVFNAALSRVPPRCIEYVVVHELTHFEVANHSKAFVELMDKRLPHWRALRDELNAFIGMPMEERP